MWETGWEISSRSRRGETVEEKGDKTQRRGVGDHACTAVSVLQKETDMRKRRCKNERREKKMMSWLAFAGVCSLCVWALWPWHYPWPSKVHPSRTPVAPHSSHSFTYHVLTNTRTVFMHTYTSARTLADMPTSHTEHNLWRERRHFQSDKVPSITPIKVSRAWLLGAYRYLIDRYLTLMSSLRWGWGC